MRTKIMLFAAMAMAPVAIVAAADKPAGTLIVRSEGLSIVGSGPTPIRATFDMPAATAIGVVSSMRGAPELSTIEDCAAGIKLKNAKFKGGLDLMFWEDKFVGWYLDGRGGDKTLKTVKGIGLGSTRAAFVKAYPKATIEKTTLGIEYGSEDAGSGLFSGPGPNAVITTMWSGQTCVAR